MIRPDALMGMIAELPEDVRPLALEAFVRAIHRFGQRSARSYQAAGAADAAALLRVIEETAPQLGWGCWRLERTLDGLTLTVKNSPFAAGTGRSPYPVCAPIRACWRRLARWSWANRWQWRGRSPYPVCAPIRGMLAAVGELAMGEPVAVSETECVAIGAPSCRFSVSRVAAPPATTAAPSR
jgi:predicted hydrocarbon binding protein